MRIFGGCEPLGGLPYVDTKVRRFGLGWSLRLVPSFFEKTLSAVPDREVRLVHSKKVRL